MPFPTTHWSLLARATLENETDAHAALEALCRSYWIPLRQFIRARGYGDSDAEDLTQSFIVHLLEHSALRAAERTRGLFRSFLMGALTRFLHDEQDRRRALKRGGSVAHVCLDEQDLSSPDGREPGVFDREWALAVLENALRQTQAELQSKGDGRFAVLRRFLPGSLSAPTYEAAAAELGLTVPAVTSEVHRVRQRLKERLRDEVARTVSAPHEIDEEMNHLQRVLMDRGNDLSAALKGSPPDS